MSSYSVAQLKEFLRARNLSIQGSKAELIARLEEFDKNIWTIVAEETVPQAEPADDGEEEEMQEEVEIGEPGALRRCPTP